MNVSKLKKTIILVLTTLLALLGVSVAGCTVKASGEKFQIETETVESKQADMRAENVKYRKWDVV